MDYLKGELITLPKINRCRNFTKAAIYIEKALLIYMLVSYYQQCWMLDCLNIALNGSPEFAD